MSMLVSLCCLKIEIDKDVSMKTEDDDSEFHIFLFSLYFSAVSISNFQQK